MSTQAHHKHKDSKLFKLFLDQLKDIYWAENKLVSTLPEMQDAATSKELTQAIADHLEETRNHVVRVEEAFNMIDEKAISKKCEAMDGLVREGKELIDETDEGTETRDAALIMASQKVEHYEIASYGSLITLAHQLGYPEVANLLHETINEEKNADKGLTTIAETLVNVEAVNE